MFLSYTTGLPERYLTAIRRAVLDAGMSYKDMRDFDLPYPDRPWQKCTDKVRSCDHFVGVLGARYGSIVPDGRFEGFSYAEMEFRVAGEADMNRFMFSVAAEDDASVDEGDDEGRSHQGAFLTTARDAVGVRTAQDADELGSELTDRLRGVAGAARRADTMVAAVAAVVVAVLVIGVSVSGMSGAGGTAGSTAATPAPPASTASRTAPAPVAPVSSRTDPCALVDPDSASVAGPVRTVPELGLFAACTVTVGPATASVVLTVPDGAYPRPDQTTTVRGPFSLTRACADDSDCKASLIPLASPAFGVEVTVDPGAGGLAGRALDTLVDSAVTALTSGRELPDRRAPSPGSLSGTSSCSLLAGAELLAVGGLSDPKPFPLFADWSCEWGDLNAASPDRQSVVGLGYSRERPEEVTDGCRADGLRSTCTFGGEVEADGRIACRATATGVRFAASDGSPRIEIVDFVVRARAPRTIPQVCADVGVLAQAAAGRMPG